MLVERKRVKGHATSESYHVDDKNVSKLVTFKKKKNQLISILYSQSNTAALHSL